ncbi:MAG: hypothetical protein QXY10_01515 [Candidatus Micrarchaeaceae archaeon]
MLTEYRINILPTQIKKEKPELQVYSIRIQNRKEKDETLKVVSWEGKHVETMHASARAASKAAIWKA